MQEFKRADFNDPGQSESRATWEVNVVKNLMVSYFDVVRKTVNDMVPKTIMAFLVNKSKNNAQHFLVQKIYQGDSLSLEEILAEDIETK